MSIQFSGFRATRPVARMIKSSPPEYEAFFIVYDDKKRKHFFRYKKGINCLPVRERKAEAEAYAFVLWEALNKGWNPLLKRFPSFDKEERELKLMTLATALDHCLKVRTADLSIYTYYGYKSCIKYIKKAAKECGLFHTPVEKLERKDIRLIIATAKEQNRWNNNSRNRNMTWFKTLLSVLVDEEIIQANPASGIRKDAAVHGPGFKRLTDEEKSRIELHLYEQAPEFLEFVMFIYQAGIRRKELTLIKIKDINIAKREITIRADVAKTNVQRIVPLADDLMDIIMRRKVWELQPDNYLFSNDKFKPGRQYYSPQTTTNLWKKLVIEGLGIDCKMYSLKHKGADDKIEAGITLEALKNLYGHSSTQMTEIYAKAVKSKHFQQIIEKSPSFNAKIIQMKKEA